MSKESVEQMMQAAGEDLDLQRKLESAGGFAEVVQIGAEKGYQFSEEDAQAFLSEHGIPIGDGAPGELSEEALEAIAGGSWLDTVGGWTDNVRINLRGW